MQYLLFCCANREKGTDIHAVQMFNAVTTFPIQPLKIARQRTHQSSLLATQLRQRFRIRSCLGIVLNHAVNRMIERHQQRYVALNDLRQHAHGGADLSFPMFIR
jgi:hypothetical protein